MKNSQKAANRAAKNGIKDEVAAGKTLKGPKRMNPRGMGKQEFEGSASVDAKLDFDGLDEEAEQMRRRDERRDRKDAEERER